MGIPFGFSGSFGLFPAFFMIVFVIILGVMVAVVVSGLRRWNRNNHSPRLTVPAVIVSKRTNVSHSGTGEMHHHTHTTYYVTFQVQSGDRMELCMNGSDYGMLAEGDRGELSFQGTRYLGFRRI
ncbi:MAG: DUF2500 domain-containing protein [Oscillospiraceae bacterium]|nr:DUF2500 domain-containing protein [Oscillospiraceae bacterium]